MTPNPHHHPAFPPPRGGNGNPGRPGQSGAASAGGENPPWQTLLHEAHQAIVLSLGRLAEARTKAEAAGVLYGEPLFRELDIALDQARKPLIGIPGRPGAAELIDTADEAATHETGRLRDACDQWADDCRRLDEAVKSLSAKLDEIDELEQPSPTPPTDRAQQIHAALVGYFAPLDLTADEAAWLAATIPNALRPQTGPPPNSTPPPAPSAAPDAAAGDPPELETAARLWLMFGPPEHPLSPGQARAIVAVRQQRGIGLSPASCDNVDQVLAWVEWARAGFPDNTAP